MDTTSTTRGKSESVTFRIESEALRKLRRQAGQKDISTNTLVNKLIKDHLNWHSNAAKAGFIPVRRPFVVAQVDIRYYDNHHIRDRSESNIVIYESIQFVSSVCHLGRDYFLYPSSL